MPRAHPEQRVRPRRAGCCTPHAAQPRPVEPKPLPPVTCLPHRAQLADLAARPPLRLAGGLLPGGGCRGPHSGLGGRGGGGGPPGHCGAGAGRTRVPPGLAASYAFGNCLANARLVHTGGCLWFPPLPTHPPPPLPLPHVLLPGGRRLGRRGGGPEGCAGACVPRRHRRGCHAHRQGLPAARLPGAG